MTSSLVEKIASLSANFSQSDQTTTNDAYVLLANQLLQDSTSIHQVSKYLIETCVNKGENPKEVPDMYKNYFFVLFEWYKLSVDELKFPLLSHLPACLHVEFHNKQHPLVDGTILCIYNCEVATRTAATAERTFRLFTSLHSNQKCIYNMADSYYHLLSGANLSDTASTHSGSGMQLTQGALKTFNKSQLQVTSELTGVHKRDAKLSFVSSSVVACIPVVLQVFISFMDVFPVSCLVDMCYVIERSLTGGMPYLVPSHAVVIALRQSHSHEQEDKESDEVKVEQISLVEQDNTAMSQKIEKRKSLIADESAREKLTHLQLLQFAAEEIHKKADNSFWPRVNLSKDILNELLTIVKYCVFSVHSLQRVGKDDVQHTIFHDTLHNADIKSLFYHALYAIHYRVLYEQIPELLLYSRSILNVV